MLKWINITQEMPKEGEHIIGYDKFYDRVGEVVLSSWGTLVFVDGQKDDCLITHWTRFPPKPLMSILEETELL